MILGALVFAQLGSVLFQTRVIPDTVYVGQQVTYEAATLVDDVARGRLRANPDYTPSDVTGVTVYDFPFDAATTRDTTVGGVHYRRYLYRRALFPLAPGRYVVPPSALQYTLPESDGYFAPLHTVTARSDTAVFVALPPPAAGRPVGFSGAVGDLRDTLHLDASALRVGDPVTMTLRLAGVGNLKLLPRPPVSIAWASVTPGDERIAWDSSGAVVRGTKEFDWIVTPRVAGDLLIPEVRYDYFDPATRRYEAAVTPSTRVSVAAAGASTTPVTAPPPDTIGDSPFPVIARFAESHPLQVGIAGAIVGVLALIGLAVALRRGQVDDDIG